MMVLPWVSEDDTHGLTWNLIRRLAPDLGKGLVHLTWVFVPTWFAIFDIKIMSIMHEERDLIVFIANTKKIDYKHIFTFCFLVSTHYPWNSLQIKFTHLLCFQENNFLF